MFNKPARFFRELAFEKKYRQPPLFTLAAKVSCRFSCNPTHSSIVVDVIDVFKPRSSKLLQLAARSWPANDEQRSWMNLAVTGHIVSSSAQP